MHGCGLLGKVLSLVMRRKVILRGAQIAHFTTGIAILVTQVGYTH